jgi:hypothetical protein
MYNPTLAYYKPKTEISVFNNITFTIAHYILYIYIYCTFGKSLCTWATVQACIDAREHHFQHLL